MNYERDKVYRSVQKPLISTCFSQLTRDFVTSVVNQHGHGHPRHPNVRILSSYSPTTAVPGSSTEDICCEKKGEMERGGEKERKIKKKRKELFMYPDKKW